MSKILWNSLLVELGILSAILGLADSTFGFEAPASKAESNEAVGFNQTVTATNQFISSLQQNLYTKEINTSKQVIPFFHLSSVKPTSITTTSDLTIETAPSGMFKAQAVAATNQPFVMVSKEQIHRQIQNSDTLTQVTSVSPVSDLSRNSKAVNKRLNLAQPPYSLNASDLRLETPASVPDKSQYRSISIAPSESISETEQLNQPENPNAAPPTKNPSPNPETNKCPVANKSQYNLLNPTPRRLLREFTTDRPDKTENPFTVDAGHYQIEADLGTYTRDVNNRDGIDTRAFQIFIPNLRVGVLNNVEFDIILGTYNNVRTKFKNGTAEEHSGFGDTTLRMKVNFFGNDCGSIALGILPFIKFPTNQDNLGNNSIEGGIIFPLAIGLSKRWDLGLQTEFDFNKNEPDPGYNVGFVNAASFGYKITNRLGTYFELFTQTTTERNSQFVVTFDTGLLYLLTENFQLDAGVNLGLTQGADDFNPFVGFSVRF